MDTKVVQIYILAFSRLPRSKYLVISTTKVPEVIILKKRRICS